MNSNYLSKRIVVGIGIAAVTFPAISFAQIAQTVNSANTSTEWNDAIWGSPAATPSPTSQYQSATGFFTSNNTFLGAFVTGRVRAYGGTSGDPVFGGDSLTIIPDTELLVKTGNTFTADLILNGGILRYSPDGANTTATMTGTIDVAANSVLGLAQNGTTTFTIGSTLSGSSALRLAGGQRLAANTHTITFDDGLGLSLNSYAGTLDIGGGGSSVVVDFNQPYVMSLGGITMGTVTADVLNLDAALTVGSFAFSGTPLDPGVYTTSELDTTFGTTGRFTGAGTLTVVPEPSSCVLLLGGLGTLLGFQRRARR